MISAVTIAEVLVGPLRVGTTEAQRVEGALRSLRGAVVADVTWDVAALGARIRVQAGLPLPDALIVASAVHHGAQAVVTNDANWTGKPLPCRAIVLDEHLT